MNYFRGTMSNRKKDIFLLSIAMPIYVTILLNSNVFMSHLLLLGKFEYGGGPIFKVVLEC